MEALHNGETKKAGRVRTFYNRTLRRIHRIPALITNLLAGYPEPFGVGNLMSMSWAAQGAYVVTKLAIPDHLRSGPRTIAELAVLTRTEEGRLLQLMRALAGFGLFASDGQGRYRLTPMSEALIGDSLQKLYILVWGEQLWPAGEKMLPMVRSGQVAFSLAHGKPIYEYYKENPEAGNLFVNFMNSVTDDQRNILVKSFDFTPYRHVVDVGGGRASLLTSVLLAYPALRGTILDQPHMAAPISERIRSANVADRCSFVGGSFLENVPSGGDLYLIKHVLHDWDDSDVTVILRNIFSAMLPTGKLIIIEGVLDDRDDVDRFLKMRDLEQMVWCGGRVRTQREFARLLDNAGFLIEQTRRNGVRDGSLIIARKK